MAILFGTIKLKVTVGINKLNNVCCMYDYGL